MPSRPPQVMANTVEMLVTKQRLLTPEHGPREDVASKIIRAEPVLGGGPAKDELSVQLSEIVRHDRRRYDRQDDVETQMIMRPTRPEGREAIANRTVSNVANAVFRLTELYVARRCHGR